MGRGESLLDPAITGRVLARMRQMRQLERADAFAALSDREMQVLAGVTRGQTNREIGDELNLSERTVRNYVSSILGKLKLASRAQAAAYATRHRIEEYR